MIIAMRESTTRRRAAAPLVGFPHLSSTGAAGSYAESANDLAAKVFLPGAVLGTATFLCWVYGAHVAANRYLMAASASIGSSAPHARFQAFLGSTGVSASDVDDANASNVATYLNGFSTTDGWRLVVARCHVVGGDGVAINMIGSGLSSGEVTGLDASADAHTVGAYFRLFSTRATGGGSLFAGRIANPAVFSRAVTETEQIALAALGPTHDLSVSSGDYNGGGPDHWWPGTGDSGTTVTDVGSVGGCNLTLNGGVTIEEA